MNDDQVVEAMAEGMCKRIFASEWGRFAEWYQREKIALWSRDAAAALAALRAAGYAIVERNKCEPWLGCATTRQLIEELTARIDVLGQLDYSTVGGTPGLVPVGGDS